MLLLVSSVVEGFLIRHGFLAQQPANPKPAPSAGVQARPKSLLSPYKGAICQPSYRLPPAVVADLPVRSYTRLCSNQGLTPVFIAACRHMLYDEEHPL